MKNTEKVALVGLALTTVILGALVINDNRLTKYDANDSSTKKPFLTKEHQSTLMKATLAKVAITGIILAYMVFDAKNIKKLI